MPVEHDTTPTQAPRCHALVPCAGSGARSGAALPKQYVELAGRPMLLHTLAALGSVMRLQSILLLLAPDDALFERHAALLPAITAERSKMPGAGAVRAAAVRCGGATRAETVRNGLAELRRRGAAADDWVLVHDAARCLVRAEWVDALIDACAGDAVGGLLALPLADTLKAEARGRVAATLPRADKWLAQTPQMFRLGLLDDALRQAGPDVTDEASAVEALGLAPLLVAGSPENFKLTYPADFALAERLLRSR
jgi:2-C-methyl-D-erythritol 4-phosphate cytidylyltransferase